MVDTKQCIFCRIVTGSDEKTDILLTVIQKKKDLGAILLTRVEQMVATGVEVLRTQGGDENDVRMGFHWPPFHTISHLHLHVISATDKMGWIARGIFKENSFWFVTSDWLLNRLKTMKEKEEMSDT